MNHIDLEGRTALITGGGSGLGLATAERLLRSGAHVTIWGRDETTLATACEALAEHGPLSAMSVDVGDADAVEAGFSAFMRDRKRLDILFNCAGTVQPAVATSLLPVEEWHRNIQVNLDSVFYTCRIASPFMVSAGYGRIINTSSMAGKEGNAFQVAYAAAKAGVIGFTKSLGKELAGTGVIVNAIVPTLFQTPLVESAMSDAPEMFKALLDKIPLGRFGDPHEAAALVAWLASEDCSFSTGFAFDLSGGRATY